MPVLVPFDFAAGSSQGRLAPPANATPFDGDAMFVLGSDLEGVIERIGVGDFVEVDQVGDVTGVTIARVKARVRVPLLAGDLVWRLSVTLDGAAVYSTNLYRDLDALDLGIPIGALTGNHRLGVRLELTGTAGVYDVELPGVYLDSVILDTVAGLALVNRDPAPAETGTPVGRSVRLDVVDAAGTSAISVAGTKVWILGVLAFNGGAFQTGFTGPESAQDATVHGGFGLRLTIDPTGIFGSTEVVSVRVSSSSGNGTIDETYTFTTEDIAAPTISEAVATERRTIRVTFSEPVVQGGGGSNDALLVSNYAIAVASTSLSDGLPAVPLEIVSVEADTSQSVILTVAIDQTPGALYAVSIENAEDLAGNPFTTSGNAALFYGFSPALPAGRRFDLAEFVPDVNTGEDETEDLARFLACLQEVTDQLLVDVDRWTSILDLDVAPEEFVDAMLASMGNPFTDFDLTLEDKRRLGRLLVPIYRQKGTASGIVNAIRFFVGIEVTLRYPAFGGIWSLGVSELGIDTELGTSDAATRYSYWIVSPVVLTDEQRARMRRLATYMHPAHEHLLGFEEPTPPPPEPDHWELGLSELGTESFLH